MGFGSFFKGLTGGSGGSSSTTASSKTNVTVNPTTNVEMNNDLLADAMENATDTQSSDSQSALLQDAGLTKQKLELQKNSIEAELNQKNQQNIFHNRQVLVIGIGALILYGYKKGLFKI